MNLIIFPKGSFFNQNELLSQFLPFPLQIILIFIIGISFGSFANLLAFRIPYLTGLIDTPKAYKSKLNIITNGSFCPQCLEKINFFALIPIVGVIINSARCSKCRSPIDISQPIGELIFGLLMVVFFITIPFDARLIFITIVAFFLYIHLIIDFKIGYLPDIISILITLSALTFHLISNFIPLQEVLLGAVISGGGLYLLGLSVTSLKKQQALGFGDVKLFASLGLCCGINNILFIAFWASILGLLYFSGCFILSYFSKNYKIKTTIAFGPMLAISGIINMWLIYQ